MTWFSQFAHEAATAILGQAYILCVLGGYAAGIATIILPRWIHRRRLKRAVEDGYMALRMVCEPATLNPEHPGNAEYMKSHARDLVNLMIGQLRRAGFEPPRRCDRSDESLTEWFQFLGQLRVVLS